MPKYVCQLCPAVMYNYGAFTNHVRGHAQNKTHQCPYCSRVFDRSDTFKTHVRSHTGERPFPCLHPGCGKAFADAQHLKQHQKVHSQEKPYKCQFCPSAFKRAAHLRDHKEAKHSGASAQVITSTSSQRLSNGDTATCTSYTFTATGMTVYQLRSDTGSAMVTVAESPQATTTTVTQSLLPKPVTVTQSIPSADCLPIVPDIFQDLPDDLQQMSAKYDFDSDKAAAPDV